MTESKDEIREREAAQAVADGADVRSMSDDLLLSSSLSIVDAYTADVKEAVGNQRWAIRVAYRNGASLRQLAEVSGLHRNTISKIVTTKDTTAA